MENKAEFYSLDVVRHLFLRKLAGEKLNDADEFFLQTANQLKHCKKMCKELEDVYNSPDMLALLRERPNSSRWDELVETLLNKDQPGTLADYVKPAYRFIRPLYNYFKKKTV